MMFTRDQLAEQYKTSANLDARIALHERFSTNPQRWMHWVFDQFDLPPNARLLELGCGPGKLWQENIERVPKGWDVTLSDFSNGMLDQARRNLGEHASRFRFACFDAASIPFNDACFDAVIANHMLYYMSDLDQTLAAIRRVLKPGGRFYASTVGANHLRELDDLMLGFDSHWRAMSDVASGFGFMLDNGRERLSRHFETVELRRQENDLCVTEAEPLAAYALSSVRANALKGRENDLLSHVESRLRETGGCIHITKDSGMFIARKA